MLCYNTVDVVDMLFQGYLLCRLSFQCSLKDLLKCTVDMLVTSPCSFICFSGSCKKALIINIKPGKVDQYENDGNFCL